MSDLAEYAVRAALFAIAFVVIIWLSAKQWRHGDRRVYFGQVVAFIVTIASLVYWSAKLAGAL